MEQRFKPGDGTTICYFTDRRAATVLTSRICRGVEEVTVQEDHAEIESGSERSGDVKYKLTPNPAGQVKVFTERPGRDNSTVPAKSVYVERGSNTRNGLYLQAGRHHYIDPNF